MAAQQDFFPDPAQETLDKRGGNSLTPPSRVNHDRRQFQCAAPVALYLTDTGHAVLSADGNNKSSPVQPKGIQMGNPDRPPNGPFVRGRSGSETKSDASRSIDRRHHRPDVTTFLGQTEQNSAGCRDSIADWPDSNQIPAAGFWVTSDYCHSLSWWDLDTAGVTPFYLTYEHIVP